MDLAKVKKIDLVNSIYEKTGLEKQDIQEVVDNLLVELRAALEKGHTI